MKSVIYNYYNILIDDINKDKDNYYFYYDNKLFLFYLVENNINVVNEVYDYFINNKLDCYEIIKSKDGNIIIKVNDKYYSLLLIRGILKYEVKFEDFKFYPIKKNPSNWGELWSNRLDYYELQVRELGFNYQTVLNSFGLFSGLAMNAILYYNLTLKNFNEEIVIGIVHNRLKYPCYLIDYNNPLNFVIDYNIRDIAEYIKSYFMSDVYVIDNVIIMLDRLNVNKKMFNLLFSRLLYPTFYFDIFDKIILEDGNDDDILDVINKIDSYFIMLRSIYIKFKDKYNLFNVEWLNKNVEI